MNFFQARYTVVRFIPDLLKDEPINIGLILQSPSNSYTRCEFSKEKVNRISRYNNDIDSTIVKTIIEDLEQNYNDFNLLVRDQCAGELSDSKLLDKLFAAHANQLQFTKPRALISANLDSDFTRLFAEFVYAAQENTKEKTIEERTMKSKLKSEFNKVNLIKNKIIIENHVEIGKFGEEIKIDFKFLNGKINLIQNLSFDVKSRDPMDYAKLWYQNFKEIKNENPNKKVNVVYCLPNNKENSSDYSKVKKCLEESCDELIDYRNNNRLQIFVKEVEEIAHM